MSTGTTDVAAAPPEDDWGSQGFQDATNSLATGSSEFGELDVGDVDADSLGKGGLVEKEGRYHLEVFEVKPQTTAETLQKKRPDFALTCVVLHSVKGQSPAGSILFHHLEVPAAEDKEIEVKGGRNVFQIIMGQLCSFGLACGVFLKRDGKIIDPETGSSKINLRTLGDRLKGCQFIGNVKREDYEKRDGTPGTSWRLDRYNAASAVDDEQNADVPMSEAALQSIGKKRARTVGVAINAPASTQAPASAATAVAEKPKFDDSDL